MLQTGSCRRELLLIGGEIRAVRSTMEEEKLGGHLVRSGLISEEQLSTALLAQTGTSSRLLGELLVENGSITQEALVLALRQLSLFIVAAAAVAPQDRRELISGLNDEGPDTLPRQASTEVILAAARAFQDVATKAAALGTLDHLARAASPPETLSGAGITPVEAYLLSRLAKATPLQSVVAAAPFPPDEAIATLYALRVAGLLVVEGTPGDIRQLIGERVLSLAQEREREALIELAQRSSRSNHYQALGLAPEAGASEVEAAWRRAEKRLSPARTAESHLHDLGQQLEEILGRARSAYEVLADPASRRRYDSILSQAERPEAVEPGPGGDGVPDPAARLALVEANFARAHQLAEQGDFYSAIQFLQEACTLAPRASELVLLARLLQHNPMWMERAVQALHRAIEVDGTCVEAWLELAGLWQRRGDRVRQREALEQALAVAPEDETACGMYLELMGEAQLARLLRKLRTPPTDRR